MPPRTFRFFSCLKQSGHGLDAQGEIKWAVIDLFSLLQRDVRKARSFLGLRF